MAEGGKILGNMLRELGKNVHIGMHTEELEYQARECLEKAGATSAFLGYRVPGSDIKYPAVLCISINETVVHGIPSTYSIQEGDVVKIDAGLKWGGWYVDAARTVIAGEGTEEAKRLLKVTEEALHEGIRAARSGNTLGDVGAAIAKRVHHAGFSVVEKLCGHGIGRALHEDPSVLNVGVPGKGEELIEGMVLAIEPMVAIGSGRVRQLPDGSVTVADGSLSAHFEHTVAITKKGPKVLTQ